MNQARAHNDRTGFICVLATTVTFVIAAALRTAAGATDSPASSVRALRGLVAFVLFVPPRSQLNVIHPDGQGGRPLLPRLNATDPAWSPDGRRIAFAATVGDVQGLFVADASGKHLRQLTRHSGTQLFDGAPSWSPNGRRIVFQRQEGTSVSLYIVNSDGTVLREFVAGGGSPSWSPDGRQIAYSSKTPNGAVSIYVISLKSLITSRLTTDASIDTDPRWSPDGRLIAFVSERDGNQEIYVMRANGRGQRRLTNNAFADTTPAWSPNGRQIMFASRRYGGHFNLFLMKVDGSAVRQITHRPFDEAEPTWQPLATRS